MKKSNEIKFDYSKLRGRIREKYGFDKDFAKAVGITAAYLSHVLLNQSELSQAEIYTWADALDISLSELDSYFFTVAVNEM